MRRKLSYERLLRMPVSFTARAWRVVLLSDCWSRNRSGRLASVIQTAYTALAQSEDLRKAVFWVMRVAPTNELEFPDEIELVVRIVDSDSGFDFIHISLKEEDATATPPVRIV